MVGEGAWGGFVMVYQIGRVKNGSCSPVVSRWALRLRLSSGRDSRNPSRTPHGSFLVRLDRNLPPLPRAFPSVRLLPGERSDRRSHGGVETDDCLARREPDR